LALAVALSAAIDQYKSANEKWKRAEANAKAYDSQLKDEKFKNYGFQLTIAQLKNSADSIFQILDKTRKELHIKEKNVESLHYIAEDFTKTDTIIINDTIFKDPDLKIDTLISDEWYSVRLGLKYPSEVSVSPDFKSEKVIIVHTKKETINPPKKFFLFRWFQKKHKVLEVDVVEKNPYIIQKENKYVEIIK
jgi:hypothetical protein